MSDLPGGPLSPQGEQELILRLRLGEEEAIRTVYQRFARPVFGMGLRILGSAEAAEELTQDVFLTAWRKADRYDPTRGRLSTWLMAIAHNMAVDRLRRQATQIPTSPVGIEDLALLATEGDEETAVLDREALRQVLAGLSPRERRLLFLAYIRGWTAREISEADGVPLGTVKTRLRSTLIKLRRAHGKEAR